MGDPVAVVIGEGRGAMVDAANEVFVDYEPLDAVTDIEAALQDGSPLVHEDLGTNECHQWSLAGGDMDAAWAESDTIIERRVVNPRMAGAPIEMPRRRRRAARRQHHPDQLDAGAALRAPVPRPAARRVRGEGPRHRPRGRRRVRRQAPGLRRGDPARGRRAQARPPGQVDRDALGEPDGHPPRSRPDRAREDGRQGGRDAHRHPRQDHRGHGGLPHAAHADDPVAGRVRDERDVQVLRCRDGHHRRLHEQDPDGRDPRRRPARGHAHDRGVHGPARRRAGDGPARAAAQELLHGVPRGDGAGHRLRLRRLPRLAGQAAHPLRRGRLRAGARGGEGARQAARLRLRHLHRDLRAGAVARHGAAGLRPADRPVGVRDGARALHGRRDRLHGRVPARPGPGDDVRAGDRRPARGRPVGRRDHARRHRDRPARARDLRLADHRGRRRGAGARDQQGRRQGQEGRRPRARGRAGGRRGLRRRLPHQGLAGQGA